MSAISRVADDPLGAPKVLPFGDFELETVRMVEGSRPVGVPRCDDKRQSVQTLEIVSATERPHATDCIKHLGLFVF